MKYFKLFTRTMLHGYGYGIVSNTIRIQRYDSKIPDYFNYIIYSILVLYKLNIKDSKG